MLIRVLSALSMDPLHRLHINQSFVELTWSIDEETNFLQRKTIWQGQIFTPIQSEVRVNNYITLRPGNPSC